MSLLRTALTIEVLLAVLPAIGERPNVIIVLADDLGYGDLGCYGQELIQTPHLDRLAAGGLRLTRGYAGSTVCAPSRAVLMTGKHAGHAAIRGNRRIPLPEEEVTIAEVLAHAGYQTALIGKWGLGETGTAGAPNAQGFDHFFGYTDQRHAHNYYPAFLWRNAQREELENVVPGTGAFGRGWASDKSQYSHDLFVEDALAWMDDAMDRESPFFLYLALTIPHANNEAKRDTGNGQEVPDFGPYAERDWPDQDKGQAAMITRMDDGVGRLVALLRDRGELENTLVIFTSDNGHHDEGGYDTTRFDPNGPLRGMKRDLYEGGIRVPFIVSWPGTIGPGVCDAPVAFWDLLPTIGEIAGVDLEDAGVGEIDGVSKAPVFLGCEPVEGVLYWEFYERGGKRAIIVDGMKLVCLKASSEQPRYELYDIRNDLAEQRDLAEQMPEVVERLKTMMEAEHTPNAHWSFGGG